MSKASTENLADRTFRGNRDALLALNVDEPDLTWRVLITTNALRLLVAALLLVLFFTGGEPRIFGERYPTLFSAVASGYLVFSIISGVALQQRWAPVGLQAIAQSLADILAILLLMHASGGISSGLGGLLIVFIGANSLVLPMQMPAILAALTTFGVLGEQLFSQLTGLAPDPSYPPAGLLSAIVLAVALAARPLANRIQASEALARQRGVDLKNLSELNEYIVQHLRESIIVIDSEDRVRLNNNSAAKLLGTQQKMRGLPLATAAASLANYLREWRTTDDLSSHPEFTQDNQGSSARITAHLAPLGRDGQRRGPVLVFLEDASEMNARVQQSKLASLGRLSASIAHEIRNPVGAMSHAAQLLAESPGLAGEDVRLTEIIQSHSDRVSHIIDNVLQLSRRESSRPERLELEPWLDDFCAEFVRTLELQEGEMSIMHVDPGTEVRMDRGHLRQVLWNLCDNAVKYASETGGILVEIRAGRQQGPGRPYLEVLDHGLGVNPAVAEQIFEPFYTERSGGTGLGLYISRELCELNRATLFYLDRPGGGSIFRIIFADPDRWEPDSDGPLDTTF
ncbi:MAG: HAMP domain-containing sensor histidine kinase [Pseudomonadota bacterium]